VTSPTHSHTVQHVPGSPIETLEQGVRPTHGRNAERSARAARRYDPDRKERLIDTTIEVIAEHGVAGTTHRRVAAAADVPLGSLTYHFAGLNDLLALAFRRHAERMSAVYEAHFDGVRTAEQFVDAVTDLIHGAAGADARDWAIAYELYLAALREPALRSITESWMRTSRAVLERFVDPLTARGVDALIEGLVMHQTLSTGPKLSRSDIRTIITRAVDETRAVGAARAMDETRATGAARAMGETRAVKAARAVGETRATGETS
jgi:TetR/AcrR family transcriptional regulator, regulator of biofilm formation and stress response